MCVCVCLFLSHFRLHVLPSFRTHLRKKARAETNSIVKKKEKEKKEKKKGPQAHLTYTSSPHTHEKKSKAKGTRRGGKKVFKIVKKTQNPHSPLFVLIN